MFKIFSLNFESFRFGQFRFKIKQIAKNTKQVLAFLTFVLLVVAVGLNWHCDKGRHSKPNERSNSEAHSDASPVAVGFIDT